MIQSIIHYEKTKKEMTAFLKSEINKITEELGGKSKASMLLGRSENYIRLIEFREPNIQKLETLYFELLQKRSKNKG